MEWIYKGYTIKENEKGEFKISHENGTNLTGKTPKEAEQQVDFCIERRKDYEDYQLSFEIVFSFGKYK